jgi:hypothetical protein
MLQAKTPQPNAVRETSDPRTVIHGILPEESRAIIEGFHGRFVYTERFWDALQLFAKSSRLLTVS